MSSAQSDRQASVRALTGTQGSIEGDWHALFDLANISKEGGFNGRLLAWINQTLGTSYRDVSGAMVAFALQNGAINWSSLGAFATWQLPGAVADFDFANDRYSGPLLSVTNANGSVIGPDGLYAAVAPNTLRREYIPRTPRTNYVRNNSMQAAVAGSPGTMPTNWSTTANANGITRTIVGTGTEGGIDYVDLRLQGTSTATFGFIIQPEGIVGGAANGQVWTSSIFHKLLSGSLSGIGSSFIAIRELDASNAVVANNNYGVASPGSGPLASQRVIATRTLSGGATVTQLLTYYYFTINNGGVVDFTIRVGWPQVEQNGIATDPIRTYGVAAQADVERKNWIRNSAAQGAVPGTPGTFPSNWYSALVGGLTAQVVGSGSVGGVDYLDWRLSGTPSASSTCSLSFEVNTIALAVAGQPWTHSLFLALVAGSGANIPSIRLGIQENNSGGSYLTFGEQVVATPTSATLSRSQQTYTTTNAGTVFVKPYLSIVVNSGQAIDITLRIGAPQLEQLAYATDPIRTTGSVVTVGPGVSSCRGLLVEGSQTNAIRNNSMQGAALGSPGTLPTNWGIGGAGALTQQIVGLGTQAGIDYIDIRLSGTTTGSSLGVRPEGNTVVAAAQGTLWTGSLFCAIVGGSQTNIGQIGCNLTGHDAAGTQTATGGSTTYYNTLPTSLASPGSRISASATLSDAAQTYARVQLLMTWNVGVAIDITIRVGWPQLEQWNTAINSVGGATSPVRTTGTAATRAADVITATLARGIASGTLVATFNPVFDVSNATVAQLGTTTDRVVVRRYTSQSLGALTVVGNAGQTAANTAANSFVLGARHASAAAFAPNDTAVSMDGSAAATTAPTSAIAAQTALTFGSGVQSLFGYIERVSILPRRATNTELQTLSNLAA